MIQRTLSGRYQLEELIGNGGMAEVYKAQDKLLDRTVAVKILHTSYNDDADFIARFQREAKAAACMAHANIVNIYDVGIDGNDHYIVMEYVEGDTLKTRIKKEGRLSVHEALTIAYESSLALQAAHENNIVHCDIKPHNMIH